MTPLSLIEPDLDFPAMACGIARDEGVIIAYIPQGDAIPMEHHHRDGLRPVCVYSMDDVVLDALPESDTKPVRWWQVREYARALKLDYPEPILACAAEDFRVSLLPDVPKREGKVLAFRQYRRGPWIKLDSLVKEHDGRTRSDAEGTGGESAA